MKATAKRLLEMKEQVNTAKEDKAEATGALNSILKQLKDEFGVNTLEAAQKKLKALLAKEEKMKQELEDIVAELESEYAWD